MMDDVTEVLEDTGTKRKEKKTKTPDTSSLKRYDTPMLHPC